jgi:SOS response regulatory protein OraA/RecX
MNYRQRLIEAAEEAKKADRRTVMTKEIVTVSTKDYVDRVRELEVEIERLKAELRGKKIKIETLRAALEDTCQHEWCDIATGGQYCRLCDARRPEYEGMAYDD